MANILRRKRLEDGSLGELEKVFEGETEREKTARLEEELTEALEVLDFLLMMREEV